MEVLNSCAYFGKFTSIINKLLFYFGRFASIINNLVLSLSNGSSCVVLLLSLKDYHKDYKDLVSYIYNFGGAAS